MNNFIKSGIEAYPHFAKIASTNDYLVGFCYYEKPKTYIVIPPTPNRLTLIIKKKKWYKKLNTYILNALKTLGMILLISVLISRII